MAGDEEQDVNSPGVTGSSKVDSATMGQEGNSESGPSPGKEETSAVDESSRLRALEADVRDQDDLERDIGRQVREALMDYHLTSNYVF